MCTVYLFSNKDGLAVMLCPPAQVKGRKTDHAFFRLRARI